MLRKIIFLLFVIQFFGFSFLSAQQNEQKKKDYHQSPYWIKMIDDSTVNYYEALSAFDQYWKGREKPEDPEDKMSEGSEKDRDEDKDRDKKNLTNEERSFRDEMIYQVKRFDNWKHEVLPYVQEDGRILSVQERMDIWQKQQEEMKKQESPKK